MQTSRTNRLIVGALCVVYFLVRLWRLTDSCLWFDEIFSVHAAEHPWGGMLWFVAQDLIHPPLFYLLLKVWIGIGGESLLWLRLFSVVFSTVAIVPFILLCRELKLKPSAILIALAFFVVNGSLIKYAQEVRMYSLLLCLSLFSFWLFARFFYRGKNIWILTIVNILLVHTHYFGWLVITCEIVAIAVAQRVKIRHVLVMVGIAVITYVPWILTVAKAVNAGSDIKQNIGWIKQPDFSKVLEFVFDLIEPFYSQQSSEDISTRLVITIPLLIAIAAAVSIRLYAWKLLTDKDRVWLLVSFCAVPSIAAFVLSWALPVSIWGSRHLIFVFAPLFILIAIFISEISHNRLRYAFTSVISAVFVGGLVMYAQTPARQFIWCAWEPLSRDWIAAPFSSTGQRRVFGFEDLVAYHFWYATRDFQKRKISIVRGINGVPEDPAYFLPRGFDGVDRIDLAEISDEEIWLAFREPASVEQRDQRSIGRFNIPVTNFEERGYRVEEVQHSVNGPEAAFLIRMKKTP